MKIAITMRSVVNETYFEQRDALARDWPGFLQKLFPEIVLIPICNVPESAAALLGSLDVEGVILSSGNDWGESPERDRTEENVLHYCKERRIPLLGICRGLQVLNVMFGGEINHNLHACGRGNHVAVTHQVSLCQGPFRDLFGRDAITVNSFHNHGVIQEQVAAALVPFAMAEHGVVEGMYHPDLPIAAVQWHPERQNPDATCDELLFSRFFQQGAFWCKV